MTRACTIIALAASLLLGACARPPASALVSGTPATSAANTVPVLIAHAREGDDHAAAVLAVLNYRAGNPVEAFKWLQLGAKRGFALAQAGLCHAYVFGLGVPQDYSRALENCRLAVEQNNAAGLNNLAYLYEHGLGVPTDLVEAAKLYRRAAMQGNAYAQGALGRFYQQGIGGPVDLRMAYFWDSLAASRLSGVAVVPIAKQRDALAASLPADVVAALQAAASNWKPGTEPPAGHAWHPPAKLFRS